ncbi:MAG: SEC-C metal-binding domain-containing protein [Thermacetogeniaceae bacterium]|jgi:SWIM/SEC-C metal-binding protein
MAAIRSRKHPAVVRVKTMAKAEEIMRIATERGWKVIVGIEPDKPENLEDWNCLIHNQLAVKIEQPAVTIGRNDTCLCGSGKKYKKCCGQ